ncbi:flagellar protein FlgN [Clostridium neonatale]|uniref:flagellar protein FlgN n=1 Tax=Clostridium neonatale TaxID=137838 RepID=UPI003D352F62
MLNELIGLIKEQDNRLKELMELLQMQYEFIVNKNLFGLEDLVDQINDCSKRVAEVELRRRNLMGNSSLTQFVSEQNNEELKKAYENIKKTLDEVKVKKETNDILLKQRLSFNSRMLAILNPNREIKTYNSYGSLRK